jgi:uncharacterized Zn finger protein
MPSKKKKSTARKKAPKRKAPAPKSPFAEIRWNDLEKWATDRIVSRGIAYQKNGDVEDLVRTEDGRAVAWVQGTERYAVQVEITEGKEPKLRSKCSCPYYDTCKHAVAVVLEFGEMLRSDKLPPIAKKSDPRLPILKKLTSPEDDEWGDWEQDDNDPDDSDFRPSESPVFRKLTKNKLLDLLDDIAVRFPNVEEWLEEHAARQSGDTEKILAKVHTEIDMLGECDYFEEDVAPPDLERLQENLEELKRLGKADDLVAIAPLLLKKATIAIENSHEFDESMELSDCIRIIFEALPDSSLSPAEQIETAADLAMADEYDIMGNGLEIFEKQRHPRKAWSRAADRFAKRLEKSSDGKDNEFSWKFHRDQLSGWLILALGNAGRNDEIIPLCEREAPVTNSYTRLVDELMNAKRWTEAENWCLKGIEACGTNAPGIANRLRSMLRTIHSKTGNKLRAIAILAEDFFDNPTFHAFETLCKEARKAKLRAPVEAWARHFLETGKKPKPKPAKSRKRKSARTPARLPDWPLPDPGTPKRPERPGHIAAQKPPHVPILIEIAMRDKKPDEVLKWFDRKSKTRKPNNWSIPVVPADDRVAEAIKNTHPDRALKIWKALAESLIARTSVSLYPEAGKYIRKTRDLLVSNKRGDEWKQYARRLRETHQRKRRFLEVLDRVESGRKRIAE